jgi:hypothetical protein
MSPRLTSLQTYHRNVSQNQRSDIRISDTEREDALTKLGEHMAAGRLDIDEYGERSAEVATAKTRGELLELFSDLPEPKPTFGQPVASTAVEPRKRTFIEKAAPVALPIAGILVVGTVLFAFKVGFFVPFLLFFLFFRGRWGGGWDNDRQQAMRDRQRRMRERHRRMWEGRGY